MSEPARIDPARLLEVINAPGPVVLLVSVHPIHAFNPTLAERLREDHGAPLSLGTVDLAELLVSGREAVPYLQREFRGLRASSSLGILPGYWLFRTGELLAWDSGLPTLSDVKGLTQSALLGAVISGLARDWGYVGQALRLATEQRVAQRVAQAFRRAVERPGPKRRPAPPPRPDSPKDISWAYQVLGVAPTASDAQVQAAWRKRRIENHPDRAAHDPVEFQRLNRVSADINRARDVILKHRHHPKRSAV